MSSRKKSPRPASQKKGNQKGNPKDPLSPEELVSPETIPVSQPENMPIPQVVSERMIRRVIIFCGIPTFLGLSSFGINYYLLTRHLLELPPYLTLIESFGLFALGFVGISYGVLSASWDPHTQGSLLGGQEFKINLGILIQQWQEHQQQKLERTHQSSSEKQAKSEK